MTEEYYWLHRIEVILVYDLGWFADFPVFCWTKNSDWAVGKQFGFFREGFPILIWKPTYL